MSEIKFSSRENLSRWLFSATGIILTSVSIINDAQDIEIQFTKPKALSTVITSFPDYFPEQEYLITYTNIDDIDTDDIDYSKMVMVTSLEARYARSGRLFGGLTPLIEKLADFDYSYTINKTNRAFVTAGIWVVEPNDLVDIKKLKSILKENAVSYAFSDGSGHITENNLRFGNGISPKV